MYVALAFALSALTVVTRAEPYENYQTDFSDIFLSLFNKELLKAHNLHEKVDLNNALRHESLLLGDDGQPSARIYCENLQLMQSGV